MPRENCRQVASVASTRAWIYTEIHIPSGRVSSHGRCSSLRLDSDSENLPAAIRAAATPNKYIPTISKFVMRISFQLS